MNRFISTRVIVRSVQSGQDVRALANTLGIAASSAVPMRDLEYMVQEALTGLSDDLASTRDTVVERDDEIATLTETVTEAQEAEQTTITEVTDVIRVFASAWCAALGVPLIVRPQPVVAPVPVKRKRAPRTRKVA